MALIRLNVSPETGRIELHQSPQCAQRVLQSAAQSSGPIIIMIHGYKYQPGSARHCPHRSIFDAATGWPAQLGVTAGAGLGICFGWAARGSLARMFETAQQVGQQLAQVIATVHKAAPHRAVHLIAHSMGAEVALSALAQSAKGAVSRVVLITGASFQSHAARALRSPAGKTAEIFNITSRENDLFDFVFERLLGQDAPEDRALGQGITAPNALNIQLDCPDTLAALTTLGCGIAPPQSHICHWSGYTRPGALAFYAQLLAHPDLLSLPRVASLLPARPSPRWSRLPLAGLTKTRIMGRLPA
ncbi:alpha/beta hydrolase [Sulfitobacter sp.]|uniref:alpha/beta hydrolase n=1 Tax=Sulfitobacter sp. TaxID=1903071 RepID=UPI0035661365